MMNPINRRHWMLLQAKAALLASAMPRDAAAQSGVNRIVVGLAPGGAPDILARLVAGHLHEGTGRTYVVENKTGASGRLAVEQVKSAAPDGNTLLLVPQGPMTLFPHVFKSLRYDPVKDFVPVTRIATGDIAVVVGPAVPAKDMAGLRSWAQGAGARAAYGSPGNGTLLHFTGVALARAIGVPMTNVPYRGTAPSLVDVAAGTLDCAITSTADSIELHKAGRVRIIATTGASRSQSLSDIPTVSEQGIDLDVSVWFALYAPAGTPAETVESLRRSIHAGLRSQAVVSGLASLGLKPAPSSGGELARLQSKESELWREVVRTSGFQPTD